MIFFIQKTIFRSSMIISPHSICYHVHVTRISFLSVFFIFCAFFHLKPLKATFLDIFKKAEMPFAFSQTLLILRQILQLPLRIFICWMIWFWYVCVNWGSASLPFLYDISSRDVNSNLRDKNQVIEIHWYPTYLHVDNGQSQGQWMLEKVCWTNIKKSSFSFHKKHGDLLIRKIHGSQFNFLLDTSRMLKS